MGSSSSSDPLSWANKSTQEFLDALARNLACPNSDLLYTSWKRVLSTLFLLAPLLPSLTGFGLLFLLLGLDAMTQYFASKIVDA